ncbi:MAG: aldo/keto reductase [Bacteroidaceae bacterium]|nr:aldo/keto reductase [Bacteroidaceae bacterium]
MNPYQPYPDRYADTAIYRRCGKSGVLLPRISLGLWKNFGAENHYETARTMVCMAFDQGITHFDLANNYGPPYGSAETTFGRILREDLRSWRDELFVSTKAGYDMWPGPYGNWGSRKYLMASLDQSLERMGLDYVDLFYIHRYDPLTPLDETLMALVDIVRRGKALYVGISRWPLEAFSYGIDFLKARDVPCLIYQGRLNLLDREPVNQGILSKAEESGVGFIGFSPLAQGLLTDRYLDGTIPKGSRMSLGGTLRPSVLTPEMLAKLHALEVLARERGEKLSQMALSWVMQHQAVTSAIVGVSSVHQLQEAVKVLHAPIPFNKTELQLIDDICLYSNEDKP